MMHFCDLWVFSLSYYSHLFVHKDKIEYLGRKLIKASQLTPDKSLLNGPIYLFLLQLPQFFCVFFKSLQVHFFWGTWLWWAVYWNLQITYPLHCSWHPWLILNYTALSSTICSYLKYYSLEGIANASTRHLPDINFGLSKTTAEGGGGGPWQCMGYSVGKAAKSSQPLLA